MKISASLYSNKNRPLAELVKELDQYGIDTFHIDCNDNPSVFDDIREIRKISTTPIDLHIISAMPERYFEEIEACKVEWATFQFESFTSTPVWPDFSVTKLGLAIGDSTSVEVFKAFEASCSFILLMTTTPGQSGGTFSTNTFTKIRQCRKLFSKTMIHVDGGVNNEVSFILRDMGVYSSVSGSYLMNHESMAAALYQLRVKETASQFKIADFMIPLEELPVLPISGTSVKDVLMLMEQSKHGFVFFVDENKRLAGICSNADLRKGLIKHLDDLNQTSLMDVMNAHPVTVLGEYTIAQMLQLIHNCSFPILFLPVVHADGTALGAVTFNNLIKGES